MTGALLLPLLLLLPVLLLPTPTDARVWGRVIHPQEVLQAVQEVHLESPWLQAHRDELPEISAALEPYWSNTTIRPILEAVKRCKCF